MRLPSSCGSGLVSRRSHEGKPARASKTALPAAGSAGTTTNPGCLTGRRARMITASDPRHLYPATAAAELLPSPGALDEAHVAAYHRDGFLAVATLLSPEEVATAKAATWASSSAPGLGSSSAA